MRIAHALGKFEHEVLTLTPTEITRWMAFFKLKAQDEKKAHDKAQREANRPRPRGRRR